MQSSFATQQNSLHRYVGCCCCMAISTPLPPNSSAGKGLTGLRKLHVLRLDHNRLEQVARGEVASLAGLVQLDLSYNQLTAVEGLGCLASLEELRLASNRLQELPNISRCKKVLRPHPLPVTVALMCCSHCVVAGAKHLLQPDGCTFSQ